jgi:hypothetical protein
MFATHVTSVPSFCCRGSIFRSVRKVANAPKNGTLPGLSVRNNSFPTGRIFMEFDTRIFFENLSRKFSFDLTLTRITVSLHKDRSALIISRSVLLRMINVSDEICTENQNTHFVFSNLFPLPKLCHLCDNVRML